MLCLLLHEEHSEYGWPGLVFAVVGCVAVSLWVNLLAARDLKSLQGRKKKRKQKDKPLRFW